MRASHVFVVDMLTRTNMDRTRNQANVRTMDTNCDAQGTERSPEPLPQVLLAAPLLEAAPPEANADDDAATALRPPGRQSAKRALCRRANSF